MTVTVLDALLCQRVFVILGDVDLEVAWRAA